MPKPYEIAYKPFPGFTPKERNGSARYWICTNGHVVCSRQGALFYGSDIHYDYIVNPSPSGKTLNVKLAGGYSTRSLPAAMAEAFATVQPPDDDQQWSPIIKPGTPVDEETGVLRCSVLDVVWVPYSEYCLWSRNGTPPTTTISIVS